MGGLKERALAFATAAHAGQVRKYTGEPYINHPMAVAALVASVPHTDEMIAAAYLHDTVEDCDVTHGDILSEFGGAVGSLVFWLTDASIGYAGNRATRKAHDLAQLKLAPPAAKTIKLADLVDNTKTIAALYPDFWKVYRLEKQRSLEVLRDGDPSLWALAASQCE